MKYVTLDEMHDVSLALMSSVQLVISSVRKISESLPDFGRNNETVWIVEMRYGEIASLKRKKNKLGHRLSLLMTVGRCE